MTILHFKGIVHQMGNDDDGYPERRYPGRDSRGWFSFMIGDRDVPYEAEHTVFKGPVTVAFADQRFTGDLYADGGSCGYSEWTPGECADLTIISEGRKHYLLSLWDRYDGQELQLWVTDEPINTLDDSHLNEYFGGRVRVKHGHGYCRVGKHLCYPSEVIVAGEYEGKHYEVGDTINVKEQDMKELCICSGIYYYR